jgi:hypothetical protein
MLSYRLHMSANYRIVVGTVSGDARIIFDRVTFCADQLGVSQDPNGKPACSPKSSAGGFTLHARYDKAGELSPDGCDIID